jgi:hypothetical protein
LTDKAVLLADPGLVSQGRPFNVAGANNRYLTFGSKTEVIRVLDAAAAMGANVVRTFIQPVIGSPDGKGATTIRDWRKKTTSSDLSVHGGKMAINDRPDGLQLVDLHVAEAATSQLWSWIADMTDSVKSLAPSPRCRAESSSCCSSKEACSDGPFRFLPSSARGRRLWSPNAVLVGEIQFDTQFGDGCENTEPILLTPVARAASEQSAGSIVGVVEPD